MSVKKKKKADLVAVTSDCIHHQALLVREIHPLCDDARHHGVDDRDPKHDGYGCKPGVRGRKRRWAGGRVERRE